MLKTDIRIIIRRVIIAIVVAMILCFLRDAKVLAATITPSSSKYDVRYTTLYCDSYNSNGSCTYDAWGTWNGQVNIGTTINSPSGTSDAFNTIGWTLNINNMVAGNTYTFETLIKIEPSSTISAANAYRYFRDYFEVVNCSAGTASNNRSTDNVSSFAYTLSQTGNDNIVKLSVSITLSSNANYISFYLRDAFYSEFRNWTKYFWDNSVTVTSLKASYTEGSNSYIQQTTQAVNNLINVFKLTSDEELNYLKDNSDASVDVSGMGSITGLLPAGPLDSLSQGGFCEEAAPSFRFVFNQTFSLPCFDIFWDEVPSSMMFLFSDVPAALLFLAWAKSVYKRVERAVTFESTIDDEWGGV